MQQSWIDQPAPVRPGEELDVERLTAYLRAVLPRPPTSVTVQQFPGGYSNLTYAITCDDHEYVLRRPPFGARIKSAHDMGREFRILSGLHRVYPKAPQPVLYCDDPAVLGAPFYLMQRRHGIILRANMPAAPAPDQVAMRSAALTLVDSLVELHAVDYAAAGLADLGRPDGYIERQIRGWAQRYQNARTEDIPEMERVAKWLAEHMPRESGAALIHNDFKYDNLIYAPGDWSRVIAILDWEMASIGDPLMDLGTTLGYWVDPDDPPEMQALQLSPTTLPGNPSRSEVAELYLQRSDRSARDLVFYYVYGLFKIAVIVQQIYARYKQGFSKDRRFAGLIRGVVACSRLAMRTVQNRKL